MVGIVVVSHSRALAQAAVELAQQMGSTGGHVPLAVAAGLDDGSLGTDAEAVAQAITQVSDTPDGAVLVLVDLGSAVLSAEMACEFIDPEVAARVRLSAAPLVEGLVAAVVTAGTGADIASVAIEAERALAAKRDQIGPVAQVSPATQARPGEGASQDEPASGSGTHVLDIVVPNRTGLHARPAAEFVRIVAQFAATLWVRNLTKDRGPVDGRSISAVATLGARRADVLQLRADGPDAPELLAALRGFADRNFGDRDQPAAAAAGDGLTGAPAQEHITPVAGTVRGAIYRLPIQAPTATAEMATAQRHPMSLNEALSQASADLAKIRRRARDHVNADAADMIAAHSVLLEDQALLRPVRAAMSVGTDPLSAWQQQIRTLRTTFENMDDEYLRARGQDVSSVGRRVGAYLSGHGLPDPSQAHGVVIVEELDAPTAVQLDSGAVLAVVTRAGGRTGHGVMVATARGIPVLVDAAGDFDDVPDGGEVRIDLDSAARSA